MHSCTEIDANITEIGATIFKKLFFYDFPKNAKSKKSAKNAKGTLSKKGAGQEGGPARLNGAAGMMWHEMETRILTG